MPTKNIMATKKAARRFQKNLSKKYRKKGHELYDIYIYKVMKKVHPDISISYKAMRIMNTIVNDIFYDIAADAYRQVHYFRRTTITSREIELSVMAVFWPNDSLANHAVAAGNKAVTKFKASKKAGQLHGGC